MTNQPKPPSAEYVLALAFALPEHKRKLFFDLYCEATFLYMGWVRVDDDTDD